MLLVVAGVACSCCPQVQGTRASKGWLWQIDVWARQEGSRGTVGEGSMFSRSCKVCVVRGVRCLLRAECFGCLCMCLGVGEEGWVWVGGWKVGCGVFLGVFCLWVKESGGGGGLKPGKEGK